MAIREELTLDLSRALQQLDQLESQLDGLAKPIRIPFETPGLDNLDQSLDEVEASVDALVSDIGLFSAALGKTTDETRQLAAALGISEDEAAALVGEFGEARIKANQVEAATREMAQALGLSDREAAELAKEMRKVESNAERAAGEIESIGRRGSSAFGGLTGSVRGLIGALVAFQGFRILGRFFGDAIGAASDLEESLSKTRVVFGGFAQDIEQFASSGPQALGLSNAAALEFTGTFGNLFVALGLAQEAAADLAPEIVQLGADLASFNNIEVTEALDKLRAGLVGEAEPLRALGVNLTAATVEAKALALGLQDSNGTITEAAKVQARYALILEQTATAQGDFARTSDGLANTQRTVGALFDALKAKLGAALAEGFVPLLAAAPDVLTSLEQLVPAVRAMAVGFGDAVENSEGFLVFMTDLLRVLPGAFDNLVNIGRALGDFSPANIFGGADNLLESQARGLERIGDLINNIKLDQLETGLVDRLREGEDAAAALESQLLGLKDINLDEGELGDAVENFVAIAGVDDDAILRLSVLFGELGEAAGFTAAEVKEIRQQFTELLGISRGNGLDFDRGGAGASRRAAASREAAEAALTEADALTILQGVADEAGVTLGQLLSDSEQIPEEFRAVADGVSDMSVRFLQSVDALDEVKAEIGTLPGAMAAAGAALRDEEGEIVDDFNTFFDNLLEELEAREAFESNLAILRALGLDNLADVFDEAGLDASSALFDAVANPAEAAKAEAALQGYATSQSQVYLKTFEDSIAALPVTQGLIDNIISAANQADTPEVRAALLALANRLQITISAKIGDIDTNGINDLIQGRLPEFSGRGTTIINNNTTFTTEPNPTTDTARITQTIAQVRGAQ